MKKIIRLTEGDLIKLVKRVINERTSESKEDWWDENSKRFLKSIDDLQYEDWEGLVKHPDDFEVVYTNSLGCEIKDYAFFANDSLTQNLTKIFPDSNSICAKDTLIFQTNINSFFEIDSIVWTFSTGDTFKIHVKDSLNKYLIKVFLTVD
jgi:hypothetical protein